MAVWITAQESDRQKDKLAAEIKALQQERDRLREALEEIGKHTEDEAAMEIAKQALAGKPGTKCTHEMCRGANRCVLDARQG